MTKEKRHHSIKRKTKETSIELSPTIDGNGTSNINTGIGFDHMLIYLITMDYSI